MSIHPEAGSAARNQFGTFEVHNATAKQVDYIRSLFETRRAADAGEALAELNEIYAQVQTGRVSKKAASRAIDLLLQLPKAAAVPASAGAPRPVRLASEKQVALIERLAPEKDGGMSYVADFLARLGLADVANLPVKAASELIDSLFALPKVAPVAGGDYEAGMYVAPDGRIFRAYLGQQSGQILAKEVIRTDETYGLDGRGGLAYSLEYRGLASKHIPAGSRRMTLEEAKEWGRATGSCVKCGRRLDVPESVDAGIGPVCAGKEW